MNNSIKSYSVSPVRPDFLSDASGPVTIRMSNDYLFRALLQRDNEALAGLIRSLLHLEPDEVKSVVVTNPIVLGSSPQDKEFILDVNLFLNDNTVVNLELQVINRHNWPERSLSYLCRAFDSLNPSESYRKAKPAIHIGLLDFTLFPEHPEFYATYQMLNVKNYALYSDKLRLSVVDLTCIDLATEEDRFHKIDRWAAFFKATTWEEIKMIAQKDESITKAANTIWKLSHEDEIRMQCEAREDRLRNEMDMQIYMEEQEKAFAEQREAIEQARESIAQQQESIAQQRESIAQQQESITQQQKSIAKQRESLTQQQESITKQADDLAQKEAQLLWKQEQLHQQHATTFIRQIRNFSTKAIPAADCASLLGADEKLIEMIYDKIQSCPEVDDACLYRHLKENGMV